MSDVATYGGLRGLGLILRSIPRTGQRLVTGVGFDLAFYPPCKIVYVFPTQPYKSIDVTGVTGVRTMISTLTRIEKTKMCTHICPVCIDKHQKIVCKISVFSMRGGWNHPRNRRNPRNNNSPNALTCTYSQNQDQIQPPYTPRPANPSPVTPVAHPNTRTPNPNPQLQPATSATHPTSRHTTGAR